MKYVVNEIVYKLFLFTNISLHVWESPAEKAISIPNPQR